MQIIIELKSKDEGVIHSSDEQKERWEKFKLTELMEKLEDDGYRINTLYGKFIFNEEKKEVIDCGAPGQRVPVCYKLADSIYQTDGKLAVIFTNKKYIAFANRYFVAMYFCHMRKVRPLSIYKVLQNYEELIVNENEELLNQLYFEKFESHYGKDADPVSCFENDYELHTSGFGVPAPMETMKPKEEK
jgi:hypothetical protein